MSTLLQAGNHFARRISISTSLKYGKIAPEILGQCKYCSSNPKLAGLEGNGTVTRLFDEPVVTKPAKTSKKSSKKSSAAEIYRDLRIQKDQKFGTDVFNQSPKVEKPKRLKLEAWSDEQIKIIHAFQRDYLETISKKHLNKATEKVSDDIVLTDTKDITEKEEKIESEEIEEIFDGAAWEKIQGEVLAKYEQAAIRTGRSCIYGGSGSMEGDKRFRRQIRAYNVQNLSREFDRVKNETNLPKTKWIDKLRAVNTNIKTLFPNESRKDSEPDGDHPEILYKVFASHSKDPFLYQARTKTALSKAEDLFELSSNESLMEQNISQGNLNDNRQKDGKLDLSLVNNNERSRIDQASGSTVELPVEKSVEQDMPLRISKEDENFISDILQSSRAYKNLNMVSTRITNFIKAGEEKAALDLDVDQEVTVKQENLDMTKVARQKAMIESGQDFMNSYLEVSVYAGMFPAALRTFKNVREREFYSSGYPPTLEMYNILMRGIATTCANLEAMWYALRCMEEDKIKPNLETYAYCLIRISDKDDDVEQFGPALLARIKKDGFKLKNIFSDCAMTPGEVERILKVFKALKVLGRLKPILKKHNTVQEYTELLLLDLEKASEQMEKTTAVQSPINFETVMRKTRDQFMREIEGSISIPSVWEGNEKENDGRAEELLAEWREVITTSFRLIVAQEKEVAWKNLQPNVYPYLCLLPESEYIDIIMQEATALAKLNQYFSPPQAYSTYKLSEMIYNRYKVHLNLQNRATTILDKTYKEYAEEILRTDHCEVNYRQVWQEKLSHVSPYATLEIKPIPWTFKIKKMLGTHLVSILLRDLLIEVNPRIGPEYCFSVVTRQREDRSHKEIKPHPALEKIFQSTDFILPIEQVPMLCPPIPFVSSKMGGMLNNTKAFLKTPSSLHQEWLHKVNPLGVLDAVSVMSNSAWVINKPVLDVVLHLFRQGGAPKLGIPQDPESLGKPEKGESPVENRRYTKIYADAISLWYSEMYKYSVANMMRDEVFWYASYLDFRGRNYPLSLVNHHGRDVIRGFMKFANSKPLGEEGLKWLKIHIINLTGLKKRQPLEERLAYAEEVMDEIRDSADYPLDGRKWWMESGDPFQTLAACMELTAALRSPNPAEFYSNLPLHQDGSCNGLQHYAALGLDVAGAKYVNLYPSDIPSDVYSMVVEQFYSNLPLHQDGSCNGLQHYAALGLNVAGAKYVNLYPSEVPSDVYSMVVEQIDKDIARDIEEIDKPADDGIEKPPFDRVVMEQAKKYLERKIIKQSVMTQVYGVTQRGVLEQILSKLRETDCPYVTRFKVAQYLMTKTFKSLEATFQAGKQIQTWFGDCAKVICNDGDAIRWITPLNFPVIQGYYKTIYRNFILARMTGSIDYYPVNKLKQRNGFPPNFIHSLDATHMMLTALHCQRAGIQFNSVHDSFWTHACDLNTMNKITREQFVALHKYPVLESLSNYFVEEYLASTKQKKRRKRKTADGTEEKSPLEIKKELLQAVPEKGDFDLDLVKKSTYFFS